MSTDEQRKQWADYRERQRNADVHWRRDAKRRTTANKLGIPIDEYVELITSPCSVCDAEPADDERANSVYVNKVTGKPAGVVCKRCATGLGYLDHDPERIARALSLVKP